MKKLERIKKNIENDKEIMKRINKETYYDIDNLIHDINTYIAAVKSGRISYDVITVSKSGMSRTIKITSAEKSGRNQFYYRQYQAMLGILGETVVSGYSNTIRVYGCGMNMLFATNYNLMHKFRRLGFISKKQCATLAQKVG